MRIFTKASFMTNYITSLFFFPSAAWHFKGFRCLPMEAKSFLAAQSCPGLAASEAFGLAHSTRVQ